MIRNYLRHKRINNTPEKVYHDWDKFKERYHFELRDAVPANNSVEHNIEYLKEYIKDICENREYTNIYSESMIFNRFKLTLEDLEEVVADLPLQLFFPIFDKYFSDIKEFFMKEFVDNGIYNTYEEVKNHIVNHMDMRFIIDPMNVAIDKTLKYIYNKYYKNQNINRINKVITNVCGKTWFGDYNDGQYELSLTDFFIAYDKCHEVINSDKPFLKLMSEGVKSSFIMYFWYLTCDYFNNSKDRKISYIRTDIEMFYMRNIQNNSANYSYFHELFDSKKEVSGITLSSYIEYYGKFINFAKSFLEKNGEKYIENIHKLLEIQRNHGDDIVKLPVDKDIMGSYLTTINELDKSILIMMDIIDSRKQNSVMFNPLERLLECITDPKLNGVEICRPSVYLDLSTPREEYFSEIKKENK